MQHRELRGQSTEDTEARRSQETRFVRSERRSTAGRFGVRRLAATFSYDRGCWREAVFRRNRSEETGEKREQAPALQKKKPRTESGRSFLPVYRTRSVMDSSSTESVVGFVSGHGFSRAVSLANSIPPLGAEGFVA